MHLGKDKKDLNHYTRYTNKKENSTIIFSFPEGPESKRNCFLELVYWLVILSTNQSFTLDTFGHSLLLSY